MVWEEGLCSGAGEQQHGFSGDYHQHYYQSEKEDVSDVSKSGRRRQMMVQCRKDHLHTYGERVVQATHHPFARR